jgi:hypothetical protein
MSQWKEPIFFPYPEVVAGMIFMVMCVNNDLGMEFV